MLGLGQVLSRPHTTWSWRGQISILGFEMEEWEHLCNLLLHSNSDNKCYRRMRGMKINAVGECVEWI